MGIMQPMNAKPDGELKSIALLLYGLPRSFLPASYKMSKLAVTLPAALMHLERFPRPAKNSNISNSFKRRLKLNSWVYNFAGSMLSNGNPNSNLYTDPWWAFELGVWYFNKSPEQIWSLDSTAPSKCKAPEPGAVRSLTFSGFRIPQLFDVNASIYTSVSTKAKQNKTMEYTSPGAFIRPLPSDTWVCRAGRTKNPVPVSHQHR